MFHQVKELLNSASLLVHFDLDRQLILSCEVSPHGVGAVLLIAWRMDLKSISGMYWAGQQWLIAGN